MGRINADIPDDLDREFRKQIIDTVGTEKGGLQKALIEAIELWLKQHVSESK